MMTPRDSGRTKQADDDAIRLEGAVAVTGAVSDPAWEGISERIATISQNARAAQARLNELSGIRILRHAVQQQSRKPRTPDLPRRERPG
ncbi:MAG TPA: hypothetical protein VMV07_18580 [Streptosporangiaceae bacterium]|nr:hypothetical protein [Streptosporangiaceae bacterium]